LFDALVQRGEQGVLTVLLGLALGATESTQPTQQAAMVPRHEGGGIGAGRCVHGSGDHRRH
jgi:hypothetical protein